MAGFGDIFGSWAGGLGTVDYPKGATSPVHFANSNLGSTPRDNGFGLGDDWSDSDAMWGIKGKSRFNRNRLGKPIAKPGVDPGYARASSFSDPYVNPNTPSADTPNPFIFF